MPAFHDKSDRELRILHVIPALSKYNGGTTEAVIGLCRAVSGQASTDIATSEEKLDTEQHILLRSRLPATNIYTFPCYGAGTRMLSVPLLRWLHKNIRRYDIVHTHTLLSPMTAVFMSICRRAGIPYIVSPHGMLSSFTFSHSHRLLKLAYMVFIDRTRLESAIAIHCATPREAEEARRWKLHAPLVVIPFSHCRTSVSHGSPFFDGCGESVLFLSRLVPNKGLELLLPALEKVQVQLGRRVPLIIAGQGEANYEKWLRVQVRDLGLDKNVTFLGFVQGSVKEQLLRGSAVFVLPSRSENFNFAVVEAMDAGIPVVISDEVGLAPYVTQYRAGIVVQRSVESVANALITLLKNIDLRREMGGNGQRFVRECLRKEIAGKQLMKLYANVVDASYETTKELVF